MGTDNFGTRILAAEHEAMQKSGCRAISNSFPQLRLSSRARTLKSERERDLTMRTDHHERDIGMPRCWCDSILRSQTSFSAQADVRCLFCHPLAGRFGMTITWVRDGTKKTAI